MRFRRREPLHTRLAREGGLSPPPADPGPHWGEVGIHGVPRLREWDSVVTADVLALTGAELRFVVLEDGTIIVEEGAGDDDPTPLAVALESTIRPPYRAEARRRAGSTWAAGARQIEVVELDEQVEGDEVSLTVHEGIHELVVDGEPRFGTVRALERWASGRFESYSLAATRLDGDLWEVRAAAL